MTIFHIHCFDGQYAVFLQYLNSLFYPSLHLPCPLLRQGKEVPNRPIEVRRILMLATISATFSSTGTVSKKVDDTMVSILSMDGACDMTC